MWHISRCGRRKPENRNAFKERMGKQHERTVSNSIVKKTQGQKVNDRTFGSDWYKYNTVHLLVHRLGTWPFLALENCMIRKILNLFYLLRKAQIQPALWNHFLKGKQRGFHINTPTDIHNIMATVVIKVILNMVCSNKLALLPIIFPL